MDAYEQPMAIIGRLPQEEPNRQNSGYLWPPACRRMGRRAEPYRPLGKVAFQFRRYQRLPRKPENLYYGYYFGLGQEGRKRGRYRGRRRRDRTISKGWAQAPESVKLEIETLLRMIYTITQTPDIAFDSVKGIGAVSGVALKLLFMDAHLKVQDKCEVFDDYLQRRLSVIQAF